MTHNLGQRGMVFIFLCYQIHSPSFLCRSWFHGVFFSVGIRGWKKKKPSAKFNLIPQIRGKIIPVWDLFKLYLNTVFFFPAKSRGKKKTVKLSPSYLFFRTTDSFVCDNQKLKTIPLWLSELLSFLALAYAFKFWISSLLIKRTFKFAEPWVAHRSLNQWFLMLKIKRTSTKTA